MKWKTYGELRGEMTTGGAVYPEFSKRFTQGIATQLFNMAAERYDGYFVPVDTEENDEAAKKFLTRAVSRVCDLHANLQKISEAWTHATVSAAVVETTTGQASSSAETSATNEEKYNAINTAGSKTSGKTDATSESAAESTNFSTTTREDGTGIYGAIVTADTEMPLAAFLSNFEKFLFSPVLWNEGGGYNYV